MTKQELNRDIKRLYNKVESLKSKEIKLFFTFIDGEFKKEFTRLYYADKEAEYLNKTSFVMMHRLNQCYRVIPFHTFYINAKI